MSCLQRVVRSVYDGAITFDDSGDRQSFYVGKTLQASVKFLDVFAVCSHASIQFLYCNPNELWILGVGPRQRFHQRAYSLPFEKHEFALCVKQLRGRRQRWHQTNLSLRSLRYAALLDILELLRDRYPCSVVRKFWLAQHTDVDKCYALEALRVFSRSETRDPASYHEIQFLDGLHKKYFEPIKLETSGIVDSVVPVIASVAQTVTSTIATAVPSLASLPFSDAMTWGKRNNGSNNGGNRNGNGNNGNTNRNGNRGGGANSYDLVDDLDRMLTKVQNLGKVCSLGLAFAGQAPAAVSNPTSAASPNATSSSQTHTHLDNLSRVLTGQPPSSAHVPAAVAGVARLHSAIQDSVPATLPPHPTSVTAVEQDPALKRLREDVEVMKLEQQLQSGKLRSLEEQQSRQIETQQNMQHTSGAIAEKLGVGKPAPVSTVALACPKTTSRVCSSAATSAAATDNRIKRLEDVFVDWYLHVNLCTALHISDSAYEAELVFSEWADDRDAYLSGVEWWGLVEPAFSGLASWKRAAASHLNHVDSAKGARTLKAFTLALLNDALEDNFECKP